MMPGRKGVPSSTTPQGTAANTPITVADTPRSARMSEVAGIISHIWMVVGMKDPIIAQGPDQNPTADCSVVEADMVIFETDAALAAQIARTFSSATGP